MTNRDGLIGSSGFVGTSLLKQHSFGRAYRSVNIDSIVGNSFETLICAGAPAQKWLANRDPDGDRANLERLMNALSGVTCDKLILISTVDVFRDPTGVDEASPIVTADLHAYGLNRLMLERFVEGCFPDYLIVRLPALVGPGLRKNALFDLHNDRALTIAADSIFQFYPVENLWSDLQVAVDSGVRVLHLTAEPVSLRQVISEVFGQEDHQTNVPLYRYDLQTLYADRFGRTGSYQYTARESLDAIRLYHETEPKRPSIA